MSHNTNGSLCASVIKKVIKKCPSLYTHDYVYLFGIYNLFIIV